MADNHPLQTALDSTTLDKSVKAQVWDDYEESGDRADLDQRLSKVQLSPGTKDLLLNLKFPSTGQPPPSFVPSSQPSQNYPQGHLTGKEVGGMAVSAIPMVTGAAGGLAFGVPGAAAGGAAGEAARQAIVSKVGPENLSGPTFKTEPPAEGFSGVSQSMLAAGAEQGAYELGGSIISRAFRGIVGGPLHVAGEAGENAAVKEVSRKYNLKLTAGEISRRGRVPERLGQFGLWSQAYIKKKWGESVANGMTAINGLLDRLAPPTSPSEAGQAVQGMFKVSNDLFSKEAAKLYWSLDQEANGVMVDMTSVKEFASKALAEDAANKKLYPNSGGYGAKTLKLLEDAAKQPDSVPFSSAHKWRSNLIKMTPQSDELRATELPGMAKKLVVDVTGAMDGSAKDFNPTAAKMWVEARKFYRDGMALFDQETITGLMSKEPDLVVKAIKPQGVEVAARIRKAILEYPLKYGNEDEQQEARLTWKQFQEQFVRSNILEDPEHTGVGVEVQDLSAIKKRINDMGPGVMKEILGSSSTGEDVLKNLTSIGEAFSRFDKLPPENRMELYRMMEMTSIMMGGITSHPVAGLATTTGMEVVPRFISGVVHSPKATGYMLDGIAGALEAFKTRPIKAVGKAAIRLQNRTVNAPKVVAAFSKANANFMRAYSLWQADTQQQTEKAEPPPAPPTEKSSGPPPTNKIDLFKDWQ